MKKKKETPMHPVVENIRKIIMDKGITQVAASELVGTSASQMSKILNGEVQISIWQISNFATNLGMEIIDVFTYPNKYVKAEDRNDNKEPIEAVMLLPDGKRCTDCVRCATCCSVFGQKESATICQWHPSRYSAGE